VGELQVRATKQSAQAARSDAPAASALASDAPDALACARSVLEVVPSVMDALRGAMRAQVGEPLSVPQFRALGFVARHPGSTVGELAAFLGVTMPTASALVDRLARTGALQQAEDPADRRRQRLQITGSGRALLGGIASGARRELAERLAACTPCELVALDAGLAVMRRLAEPAQGQTAVPPASRAGQGTRKRPFAACQPATPAVLPTSPTRHQARSKGRRT